jgi:hypothetical protein
MAIKRKATKKGKDFLGNMEVGAGHAAGALVLHMVAPKIVDGLTSLYKSITAPAKKKGKKKAA